MIIEDRLIALSGREIEVKSVRIGRLRLVCIGRIAVGLQGDRIAHELILRECRLYTLFNNGLRLFSDAQCVLGIPGIGHNLALVAVSVEVMHVLRPVVGSYSAAADTPRHEVRSRRISVAVSDEMVIGQAGRHLDADINLLGHVQREGAVVKVSRQIVLPVFRDDLITYLRIIGGCAAAADICGADARGNVVEIQLHSLGDERIHTEFSKGGRGIALH